MVARAKNQQLSRDALLGIVACVAGIAGVVFELQWITRSVLVAFAVALIFYTVRRHSSHIVLKAIIGIVIAATFVTFSCGPIWVDFHKKHPNVALQWPVTFHATNEIATPRLEPPDLPPLDLPGPPLSKWGKVLYLCPLPSKVDPADRVAAREAIRRNADIYGNALGVSVVLNDIPYGVRFDVTAKGAEGEARMGPAQRFTVQLEAASKGIFVTVLLNLPGGLGVLESVGVDRDSDIEKVWTNQVERMVGAPEGKCRLL
jgi:hypothetical protein